MPKGIRWVFKIVSGIISLIIIVSVIVVGGAIFFNSSPKRLTTPFELLHSDNTMKLEDDSLFLEIRNGESASSVGQRLENSGVIRSRYFWNLLFRLDNEHIKTGTYKISLPATQMEIRSILISGSQLLVRVTVPEGVTLKKAAKIIEEAGICSADGFLAATVLKEILDAYNIPGPSMEGYLFPDTYLFPLNYPASRVVSAMADTFFSRLKTIAPGALGTQAISPAELNRRVTIASIIEREYQISEEAPLIAGVFFNRLRIGMALQSCATVEYVITEVLGKPHPEQLFNRDLEIKDPYNTYLYPGLPPGPISAPGEIALRAAFNPASSDYLYFRLIDAGSGKHYFSKTLDDHIRAGSLYLKRR